MKILFFWTASSWKKIFLKSIGSRYLRQFETSYFSWSENRHLSWTITWFQRPHSASKWRPEIHFDHALIASSAFLAILPLSYFLQLSFLSASSTLMWPTHVQEVLLHLTLGWIKQIPLYLPCAREKPLIMYLWIMQRSIKGPSQQRSRSLS